MIFIISIYFLKITITTSSFLDAELNYYKPKLERNNVVNKGVWVKDKFSKDSKPQVSDFIFKSTSMDVDDLFDNDFYTFGASFVENTPFVSNYIERAKRSSDVQEKQRLRKNMKKCGNNGDCYENNLIEDETLVESKLMTKLKPASVFNDYPYEVAVLLRNAYSNDAPNYEESKEVNEYNKTHIDIQILVDDRIMNNTSNDTLNISIPKRSMNKQNLNFVKQEIVQDYNGTESKKVDKNIFKDNEIWQLDTPLPDIDTYKVIPAIEKHKIKFVNERGLMKVIAILSKAFKKIMRQHADIKRIHNKLHAIKQDVDKSVNILFEKFQEFEHQYAYLANISEKMKHVERKFESKNEYISNKENELSKNLIEFESQQKKFLTQQREFYNIQKLMLAQNEKINTKQNFIAKTQSEISHRQYNFARILKKAKEIYIDGKTSQFTEKGDKTKKVYHSTTAVPLTTESIKINLFSIPPATRIVNQDKLILKEIDEQSVDDLIYKYYFNNTFIDNIMKNKILSGFASNNENNKIMRDVTKRDENSDTIKSTILVPVNNKNDNVGENKIRKRRWIRHTRKLRRKHRGKTESTTSVIDDEKKRNQRTHTSKTIDAGNTKYTKSPIVTDTIDMKTEQPKKNAFRIMAANFCNQIGHNGDNQVLNWCIEKVLRRLKNIDAKIPTLYTGSLLHASEITTSRPAVKSSAMKSTTDPNNSRLAKASLGPTLNLPKESSTTLITTPASLPAAETTFGSFPGNDELESNLKQYEIVTDKEGVFYYDSAHSSEGHANSDAGVSDMMLGLESNSRYDVDPITFDLHSKRRASVLRINEKIRRKFLE